MELSKLQPLSVSQAQTLEEQTTRYEDGLTVEARDYLEARGVGWEAVAGHRLGVVADPAPGHERFKGMLAIPYLSKDGEPWDIRFACMVKHDHSEHYHAKYNTQKDKPARIYNVKAIHQAADVIHITEGEMDCLTLGECGLLAVAMPGANAWQSHYRRALAGFSKVVVWPDVDEAGAEFYSKISQAMNNTVAVKLPFGDVNDVFVKLGAEGLLSLIRDKGVTA